VSRKKKKGKSFFANLLWHSHFCHP